MTRQIAVITSWAILAAAGGSQAAGSSAPNASTNGFQITQRQQDTTIVTVLSADGVAATQLDSSGAPIRGVILRYVDGMTFGLDYSDNTAHAADLASAVAAKLAENQRVASITALPEIGGNVNGALTPPRTFARVPGANQIGGLNALAIAIDAGANKTRIWYSPDLPQIPGPSCEAQLAPSSCGRRPASTDSGFQSSIPWM